jgi:hypothetical protein
LTFQSQPVEGYVIPAAWDAQRTVRFVVESGLAERDREEAYKKTTRQTAKVVAFLYFYGGNSGRAGAKTALRAE